MPPGKWNAGENEGERKRASWMTPGNDSARRAILAKNRPASGRAACGDAAGGGYRRTALSLPSPTADRGRGQLGRGGGRERLGRAGRSGARTRGGRHRRTLSLPLSHGGPWASATGLGCAGRERLGRAGRSGGVDPRGRLPPDASPFRSPTADRGRGQLGWAGPRGACEAERRGRRSGGRGSGGCGLGRGNEGFRRGGGERLGAWFRAGSLGWFAARWVARAGDGRGGWLALGCGGGGAGRAGGGGRGARRGVGRSARGAGGRGA